MTEAFDDATHGGARAGRATRSNPLLVDVLEVDRPNGSDHGAVPESPGGPSAAASRAPEASPSAPRAPEGTAAAPGQVHGAVCTIGLCPICTLVTAFGDVRPELTEHLLLAGREILLALKVMIDARLQGEEPPEPPASSGGLEHISID